MARSRRRDNSVHEVAGNGLLHRRALLGRGIMVAGAMSAAATVTGAVAESLTEAPWAALIASNAWRLRSRRYRTDWGFVRCVRSSAALR